jgi:NADPH:quinone reductase-like Zn-dependent oxidoreductase/acyl carrier protein
MAESLADLRARAHQPVDPRRKYDLLRELGVELGPKFQLVRELHAGAGHAFGGVDLPADAADYRAHPALIDSWLQVLTAALNDSDGLYLPSGIQRFELFECTSGQLWCSASLNRVNGDTLRGDIQVFDNGGLVVARIEGLTLRRASSKRAQNCLYELAWRKKNLPESRDLKAEGSWLILADSGGVGGALASELQKEGAHCRFVEPGGSIENALQAPGLTGVVYLRALDAPSADHLDTAVLSRVEREIGASIIMMVRTLAARKESPPQLVLVTRGAQAASGNEVAPAQSPVWGLARTIRLEHPELRTLTIDLDPQETDQAHVLLRELAQPDDETQIAWRGAARLTARLVPLNGDSLRLELTARGSLDQVVLSRTSRRRPGPGEVEIQVASAGLNFRDVLNALDLYPGDPGPLGAECAGYVVDTGEGVEDFVRGDEVVTIARGSLGTHVTADALLVARKPAQFSMEQAASLPVAYMTARYALNRVGGIRSGESVLIHAAAGGVGLAAIAEARRVGAEVFATAGSDEKRSYLRSLGIAHVFSSRTLDYVREILDVTGGRGVDLVLNSLSGDFIAANFRVLAPQGRYLEIGKNGIWEPDRVAEQRPDVRYSIIDWGQEYERAPESIAAIFQESIRAASAGEVSPLPCRSFKLSDAANAFRWMAQARHIGKVVLSPAMIRDSSAYLITGGFGGLGLRIAERLVERGARVLSLVGRRSPGPEAQSAIQRMEARGARVMVHEADVSRKPDLEWVFKEISRNGTPLKGIVHAAGVFENKVLFETDPESFARVLAPKVQGAWALHELTPGMDLDFFVMFSSIASVLGAPGQASYAAANSFLDSLAHFRFSRGLPALSVNWGAWGDVGKASGQTASSFLSERGAGFFSIDEGLELFELSLAGSQPQFTAARMNWEEARRTLGSHEAFLSEVTGSLLVPARESAAAAELVQMLARTDADRRPAVLLEEVRRRACAVLGIALERPLDPDRALSDLGLDSLMAVELRNSLSAAIGKPLPSTLTFSYPSVRALAEYLASQVDQQPPAASPDPEMDDFLSRLEQLSEGEVEQLLRAEETR